MAAFDRVALLRAVNLGGYGQIAMAELRALFYELGFAESKTLLNSGNVVFAGGRKSDTQLERLLESEMEKHFGVRMEYFVRDAQTLRGIIDANPLKREAKNDPGRLVVYFLKETLDPKTVFEFGKSRSRSGPEVVVMLGRSRHMYIYYPDGQGRSKLKLPWLGTARNWNTVTKLAELLE